MNAAKPTTSAGHIHRYRNDSDTRRGPAVADKPTISMNAMLTTSATWEAVASCPDAAVQNEPSTHTNRHAARMPNPARPIDFNTRGRPLRALSCASANARCSAAPRYSAVASRACASRHESSRHKPDIRGNAVTTTSAIQPCIAETTSTSTAAATADAGAKNSTSSCVTFA